MKRLCCDIEDMMDSAVLSKINNLSISTPWSKTQQDRPIETPHKIYIQPSRSFSPSNESRPSLTPVKNKIDSPSLYKTPTSKYSKTPISLEHKLLTSNGSILCEDRQQWDDSEVHEVSNDSNYFERANTQLFAKKDKFPLENDDKLLFSLDEICFERGEKIAPSPRIPTRNSTRFSRQMSTFRQNTSRMSKVDQIRSKNNAIPISQSLLDLQLPFISTPVSNKKITEKTSMIKPRLSSTDNLIFLRERRGRTRLTVCPGGNFRSVMREKKSNMKTSKYVEDNFRTSREIKRSTAIRRSDSLDTENVRDSLEKWLQRANPVTSENDDKTLQSPTVLFR